MHNKFYIFDNKTLITGSANLSHTDMSEFNSNSIIVIESKEIAKIYKNEFEQMYGSRFSRYKKPTVSNAYSDLEIYFSPKDDVFSQGILPYIKNFKVVEELFDHTEEFVDYCDELEPLVTRYANEYKVNKEHLLVFIGMFGLEFLKHLKSKNIINLLNLNEIDFNKIMQILEVKMDDNSFNNSVNALLQRKFRIKVPEIVMIFPGALQAIEEGNKKELGEMLDLLAELLTTNEVYNEHFSNKEIFVDRLVAKDEVAIDRLHTLTSKFIKLKRNEYVRNETELMWFTIILLVIIVQVFQEVGMLLAKKFDHRINK
jgi:thiol-disulfide isomerase/thioredoxin